MNEQNTSTSAASPLHDFSFAELRRLVYEALDEDGLSHHGGRRAIGKSLLIVALWVAAWLAYLGVGMLVPAAAIPAALVLMVATLALQLGVMHDASHGSISRHPRVNGLFASTLTCIGASSILWYQKHVVGHHVHTNIPGGDPDIESGGLFRFHDGDPRRWYHRWQHWYALPLYALLALRWVWVDDVADLIRNRRALRGRRGLLLAEIIVSRLCHALVFLVLPALAFGWPLAIACYLLMWTTLGAALAITFQLAHVTGEQAFPERAERQRDWAAHQIATTADFAVRNRFLTWLVGGLNYQVEHHVFPNVSSLHYPRIQPIVRDYCASRGVDYHEFRTLGGAIRAHFGHLRRLALAPGPDEGGELEPARATAQS